MLSISLFAWACGPRAHGGGTGDGGLSSSDAGSPYSDAGLCNEPLVHRPTPTTCTHPRPAVTPVAEDGGNGVCQMDSDCDGGVNGRCTPETVASAPVLVCTYDECTVDSDCGESAVCSCRGAPPANGPNLCVASDCQVDSDCAACGYCSPSRAGCGALVGVGGWFCHTHADACTNDADCGGLANVYCVFDAMAGWWKCQAVDCTG